LVEVSFKVCTTLNRAFDCRPTRLMAWGVVNGRDDHWTSDLPCIEEDFAQAVGGKQRAASSKQQAAHTRLRTANNMQHIYEKQETRNRERYVACRPRLQQVEVQQSACGLQHAVCNIQHVASSSSMENGKEGPGAGGVQKVTGSRQCETRSIQHAASMPHAV